MKRYSVCQTVFGLCVAAGLAVMLAGPVQAAAGAAGGPAASAIPSAGPAAGRSPAPVLPTAQLDGDFGWGSVAAALRTQLEQDQGILRIVGAALGRSTSLPSGRALASYSQRIGLVRQHVSEATAQIQSYEGSMNSLLQVLGSKAEGGEDATITRQRMIARKTSLDIAALQMRVRLCDLQTRQLEARLDGLRRKAQQGALVRHVEPPLSIGFWRNAVADGYSLFKDCGMAELNMLIGVAIAILTVFIGVGLKRLGAGLFNTALARAHWSESIRAQRALGDVLGGVLCAVLAEGAWQGWEAALGNGEMSSMLGVYLPQGLPVLGFVVGAGVSLRRWLRGRVCFTCSLLLGGGLLFYGALRTVEIGRNLGPGLDAVLEALFALSSAIFLYLTCRADKRRRQAEMAAAEGAGGSAGTEAIAAGPGTAEAGPPQDIGALLVAHLPIHGVSALLLVVTLLAVLSGYMSFAFLLNGWVLALLYAFGVVMLAMQAWRDFAQIFFSSQSRLGRLWEELGLSARRLSQMEVISTALVGLGLVMVFIALLQGSDGVSFTGAWQRLQHVFTGGIFLGVPLSPRMVVSAAVLLVGVFYAIRFLQQWLVNRLFPVTSLDSGAQTSIISILTYTLWIAAGLQLLALIGISVQNLTWVVSALSVGVGFGLQSIVKDFISGLILLAERPAQAGDKITISGNTGVIQRVNVRATDLRLSDGTTLIVPNSQFITANVQNYSAGRNPLKMSLVISVPTNVNLDKVQALFMLVVADQPDILRDPAPSSTLGARMGRTIEATLSLYTARGTNTDAVRTALMGALLERFSSEGISLMLHEGNEVDPG